ncbi:MAG: autotransporter outer membrane beta-barrel domain-containing protein, partial [Rickettsiales bacterium]|nr:autotransporter outer membrane beta-barrel domain-containing protein [Rickettsiales bacterium]
LNFNEAKKEGDKEKYLGFWSKGFGGTKKQSDDGKIKGYSSSIAGLAIGFDKRLEDFDSNNVIGIAVGYSHSSIDGNSKTAKNDDSVNSYNVALYNSNGFGDGLGLYNENSLNIALNQYDTKRNIKVGTYESSSKGSFDGASYMAKTSVGYRLKLQEKLLFNPNISARYVNVSMDDYEETGAGNNSLKVRNEDFDNVIARMSFDFAYKDIYEKFKFIPKFDIYFETKLMDAKHEQSFAFVGGGSYLKNNSIDVQKNKFGLDLGVNLYSKKDHYFDLNYNFEGADGFTSHLGAFEYRYEF